MFEGNKMIYFDNAATSKIKPEAVYDAVNYYLKEIGTSPGRGSYNLAIQASRMLYQSRKTVASFFDIDNAANVVFTKNSTEAINLFLNGYLQNGDHIIISPFEHNAVLRPVHSLAEKGIISYSVLDTEALYSPKNNLKKYVNSNTRLIVLTFASNLTGQFVFNKELSTAAHELGLKVFVDSSQGGGKKLISMKNDGIDFLAFTGHKDLLAIPGVGGLVSLKPMRIAPLIQGGTGIHGESYTNPEAYPDSYESGTLNMPAIWSLKTSIDYIQDNSERIKSKEKELIEYLIKELSQLNNIILYNKEMERVPTICFNVEDKKSNEVVSYLNEKGICVRGGIHCAIKAHETINTVKTGAVRVSLNFYNTFEEIDTLIEALKEI